MIQFFWRQRIKGKSHLFYRRDKHAHFLSALVICVLNGHIFYLCIGNGRNHDSNLLDRSGASAFLLKNQVKVLADRGFRKPTCYYPVDPELTEDDMEYNNINYEHRSVVENIYSRISKWGLANNVFKQDVELQHCALSVIYQIEAWKIIKRPVRDWDFEKKKTIKLKHFDLLYWGNKYN